MILFWLQYPRFNLKNLLQGVASKDFKSSSVKKLFILSVYPQVPEVHINLKNILEELNIEAIDFLVSADIKMRKFLHVYCRL